MTASMLRDASVESTTPRRIDGAFAPGPIAPRHWAIEPDLSSAVPFLAAAV